MRRIGRCISLVTRSPLRLQGLERSGLRVSTKSVYSRRRSWAAGGVAALAFRGTGGAVCRLDDKQPARPVIELGRGPAEYG
jgi:hypothetical protein